MIPKSILLLAFLLQVSTTERCPDEHFRVDASTCHKLLTCEDRPSLDVKHLLPGGYVKELFLAQWNSAVVIYSTPRHPHTKDDFLHGIRMLHGLQGSSYVARLVGSCSDPDSPFLVTQFYKHGSVEKLEELVTALELKPNEELDLRLNLAEDYISILEYLHSSPLGVCVMCDSNDLMKTMSQYVITDDLRLALLDVDALPVVDHAKNATIKCGSREIYGDFVAPEQLWPYPEKEFVDSLMPGYDEKTDIWKVPDVLQYLVGGSNAAYRLKLHLFETFRRCKEDDPARRPEARYIKDVFMRAVVHERRIKLEL